MAVNNIAAKMIPVRFGVVRRRLLNNASRRKEMFCSQMFRKGFGQGRLIRLGLSTGGSKTAPR
jgi:hypothetical protein